MLRIISSTAIFSIMLATVLGAPLARNERSTSEEGVTTEQVNMGLYVWSVMLNKAFDNLIPQQVSTIMLTLIMLLHALQKMGTSC